MTTKMLASDGARDWLTSYKAANAERLDGNPEFAAWLEKEYVPIAGGWQY